jgi:hypothetical protein
VPNHDTISSGPFGCVECLLDGLDKNSGLFGVELGMTGNAHTDRHPERFARFHYSKLFYAFSQALG